MRTEAAWAALEGALARRVVAARAVAAAGGLDQPHADELRALVTVADTATRAHRADAENDLSRALVALPPVHEPELALQLADAGERVTLARRFYNDAVRDTRALRGDRFTRVFGLAGRAALPDYFEIAEHRRPEPVRRTAARVLLLDDADRVLLLSGTDPRAGASWWFTPGGGVESGEDLAQAAVREVAEETGLQLAPGDLVGPIWRRTARFAFVGVDYEQTEFYFAARSGAHPGRDELDTSGRTELEHQTLTGHRWWEHDDLAEIREQVFPVELADRLTEARLALDRGEPAEVVEVR
ncbi:NUDIX domain-containing protein [Nakamurella flavida]|uniref:NUDIX domain-containing protein n=1 Tax=Nakamurella flavida TaxID=363630 RepID=A0A938YMR9_9ACTN|nr:NUDIX domain-containing protein [Nakamurella flavida]